MGGMSDKTATVQVYNEAQAATLRKLFEKEAARQAVYEIKTVKRANQSVLVTIRIRYQELYWTIAEDGKLGHPRITTEDDPRCTDPRWSELQWEDYFGNETWDNGPGVYGVRSGSDEDGYWSEDAIGAVVQAMKRYPKESDIEIESWSGQTLDNFLSGC